METDLDDAGGVAEAVAGDVVGEHEADRGRRNSGGLLRLEPHSPRALFSSPLACEGAAFCLAIERDSGRRR